MAEPVPQNSRKVEAHIIKTIKEIAEKLQQEINKFNSHPDTVTINPFLYTQLIIEIEKIKENAFNPDIVHALEEAKEQLAKAEEAANSHKAAAIILEFLVEANSHILKCKNLRA